MSGSDGKREGGCACGQVRFRINEPVLGLAACYCRDCQRATGGAQNYVVLAPRAALELLKGEPKVHRTTADSGNTVGRAFCRDCGSPLWTETAEGTPFLPVKAGALDAASDLTVSSQVYTASAQPWHLMHEGVHSFEKMPPAPKRG